MRQLVIKISIFIVTFIAAYALISSIMNKGNTDLTVEMSPASYPVISMNVEGYEVNWQHGYSSKPQGAYLRDTLTPLSDDRKLYVKIKTMGNTVEGISYEVRSADESRLVENTEVYDYADNGDTITADFSIKDLIEKDKEYILTTILKLSEGREVRYYTRIIQSDSYHISEQLAFITDFHRKLYDKDEARSIITYLESNAEGDNSSFSHVDIHSSFQQVTWGSLNIIGEEDLNMQLCELDPSIAAVRLDYRLLTENGKSQESYLVKEYFRIRYTADRIYLLDYDRTMNQIFDPSASPFVNDKVMLGITGDDVMLTETADGETIVFEQLNSLYEYKNSDGKLSRVFSFYDENNYDIRTLYDKHFIKLLNVDELGNIFFIVSGYMNRGRHEGQVGTSVMHYDNSRNYVEEKVFIPYDKSYGILKENISRLAYINRKQELYVYIDGNIYCIGLDTSDGEIIVRDLPLDKVVTSKSNQMVAWESENESSINLMDLNSGKNIEITGNAGEKLNALGFSGDNLVYGIANAEDKAINGLGVEVKLMHTVIIQDKNGTELKRYSPDNAYVIDAAVSDTAVVMNRVRRNPDTLKIQPIEDDQIMNSATEDTTRNSITRVAIESKETVTEIALINNVPKSISLQVPKEVLVEGGREFNIEEKKTSETDSFYVYAKGCLEGIFSDVNEAVENADLKNGVVVDKGQDYIWRKSRSRARAEIKEIVFNEYPEAVSPQAMCLDAILSYEGMSRSSQQMLDQGMGTMRIMEESLDARILNLSGCRLNMVLYYVGNNKPVLAKAEGRSVLIVGYDEKNIIVMDPLSDKRYKKGMNDSAEWFEDYGNEFIAYVK